MTVRRMFACVVLAAMPLGGCGGAAAAVTIDNTRLEPISFAPAVNASSIAVESNISIGFNKDIRHSPGNVILNATLGLTAEVAPFLETAG